MPKIASTYNVSKPDPNAWQLDRALFIANSQTLYWKVDPAITTITSSGLYVEQFSIAGQETSGAGIEFTPNGTVMYVLGSAGDDINKYALSTPWRLDTATFVAAYQAGAIGASPSALRFSSNGYYAYILNRTDDTLTQYRCGTNWDVSSLTSVATYTFTTQDATPQGFDFSPDGYYLYMAGGTSDDLFQYNLSTPWELSSVTYSGLSTALASNPNVGTLLSGGLKFGSNGTVAFIMTDTNMHEINFTQSWNVATRLATAGGFKTVNTFTYSTANEALAADPNGRYLYVLSAGTDDKVVRFSLDKRKSLFSVSAQDTVAQGLTFKPDGTKMYVVGQTNDSIYEYNLSTPWNIDTATFVRSSSVTGNPESIYFKPDGTSYYVLEAVADSVFRYDCSQAWNVATSSFITNYVVGLQENVPYGLFFKPDGTKMFIYGSGGDDISEYTLSTPWDISTASFRANTSSPLATLVGLPIATAGEDIKFRPDGKMAYWLNSSNNLIHFYSLSQAWNVQTLTSANKSYLSTTSSGPTDFYIRDDGKMLFILDATYDGITAHRMLNLY